MPVASDQPRVAIYLRMNLDGRTPVLPRLGAEELRVSLKCECANRMAY